MTIHYAIPSIAPIVLGCEDGSAGSSTRWRMGIEGCGLRSQKTSTVSRSR
jgi:hypothetical protein